MPQSIREVTPSRILLKERPWKRDAESVARVSQSSSELSHQPRECSACDCVLMLETHSFSLRLHLSVELCLRYTWFYLRRWVYTAVVTVCQWDVSTDGSMSKDSLLFALVVFTHYLCSPSFSFMDTGFSISSEDVCGQ